MQRISLVEKDQAHPLIKETYQKLEDRGSQVLNLFKVMGHCPHIGLNFQRLGNSILMGEELPAKLRELAILRVSNLLPAEYEFVKHVPIALRSGVSQKQIDEVSDWAASVMSATAESIPIFSVLMIRSYNEGSFQSSRNAN